MSVRGARADQAGVFALVPDIWNDIWQCDSHGAGSPCRGQHDEQSCSGASEPTGMTTPSMKSQLRWHGRRSLRDLIPQRFSICSLVSAA